MSGVRDDSEERAIVRRRWSASETVAVSVKALWDFRFRNEAGGVCGAFPRAFLSAHVWCDHIAGERLGHFCREGPPPHDLLVYILPNDNPGPLYQRLRDLVNEK